LDYAKLQMRVNPELAQKGFWHTLKHVMTSEVGKEARKALGPSFLFNIPRVVSRFFTFQTAKEVFFSIPEVTLREALFLSGFCGGLVEGLFAAPQQNLQAKMLRGLFEPNPQNRQFTGTFDALKKISAQEGFKDAYRGFPRIALRHGLYNGALFTTFTEIYGYLQPNYATQKRDTLDAIWEDTMFTAISGSLSGAICGLVNAPFTIAEKRFMKETSPSKGILEYMSKIHQKEGYGAFFKGIVPRMMRSSLDAAIAFTMFDFTFQVLKEL